MSAEYYQKTKKGFQRRLVKNIKIFLKKIKTKSVSMLVNGVEIFLKKKNKKQQYGHKSYKNLSEDEKKLI